MAPGKKIYFPFQIFQNVSVQHDSLYFPRAFAPCCIRHRISTSECSSSLTIPPSYKGCDSIPVRRPDSQSREPSFKSHCGRFEPLASLITPRCHNSLSCINEYLAIQTVVDMWTNSLRAAIAAWMNTSQRSWDGFGMNRSARGWSVKRFEQSYGPDTVLYKNIPLLFTQSHPLGWTPHHPN